MTLGEPVADYMRGEIGGSTFRWRRKGRWADMLRMTLEGDIGGSTFR